MRATLEQVQKNLNSDDFLRIDKSSIVNMKHVMALGDYQVKLRDGTCLSVSHPQIKNVKLKLAEYWSREC